MKLKYILSAIALFLIISSCSTEKRTLRKLEKFNKIGRAWLELNPCANDSNVVYVEGKKDSIYLEIPTYVKDTTGLSHFLDSLNKALQIKFDEQRKNCSNQVNEAYKLGYKKSSTDAQLKYSSIKIPLPSVDTIKISIKDKQQIELLKADLLNATAQLNQCQLDSSDKKGSSTKWFLLFIIASCLFLISLFFNFKK